MQLPTSIETHLRDLIIEISGKTTVDLRCRPAAGGSINEAAAVSADGLTLFVKWNHAQRYPGMFEAEARGLKLLGEQGGALVPGVLGTGDDAQWSWLILEHIEPGHATTESADRFGAILARLHRNTAPTFGLDHDNYMGSLIQTNTYHSTWHEFYIQQRLLPQVRIARDEGNLSGEDVRAFDTLFGQLQSIFPDEPPALVHGDLWSGNYLTSAENHTYLIDPAVAYGHREVDIAMSRLFGGFPARFYQSYNLHFPMVAGWESRIEIFQLYPLLIHVNLFGGGYVQSVKGILRKFRHR
ncbi:MAG: fructosamine kinase family protein [Bacteroidales bacterium]